MQNLPKNMFMFYARASHNKEIGRENTKKTQVKRLTKPKNQSQELATDAREKKTIL